MHCDESENIKCLQMYISWLLHYFAEGGQHFHLRSGANLQGCKNYFRKLAVSFFSTHRLVGILAKYIDFSNLSFILCQLKTFLVQKWQKARVFLTSN